MPTTDPSVSGRVEDKKTKCPCPLFRFCWRAGAALRTLGNVPLLFLTCSEGLEERSGEGLPKDHSPVLFLIPMTKKH